MEQPYGSSTRAFIEGAGMSRPCNDTGKRTTLWLVASALLIAACSGGEVAGDGASLSSASASMG
jgi:hypothetical protein